MYPPPARCLSAERTTDDAGGHTQKSGFLKTVIPHNSSAASQVLLLFSFSFFFLIMAVGHPVPSGMCEEEGVLQI